MPEKPIEIARIPSLYERIFIAPEASFEDLSLHNLAALLGIDDCVRLAPGRRNEKLIENVQAGSLWLSQRDQYWPQKINPATFHLGTGQSCVLACVFNITYGNACDRFRLDLPAAVNLGFHPGGTPAFSDLMSRALQIIWLTKVKSILPPPIIEVITETVSESAPALTTP